MPEKAKQAPSDQEGKPLPPHKIIEVLEALLPPYLAQRGEEWAWVTYEGKASLWFKWTPAQRCWQTQSEEAYQEMIRDCVTAINVPRLVYTPRVASTMRSAFAISVQRPPEWVKALDRRYIVLQDPAQGTLDLATGALVPDSPTHNQWTVSPLGFTPGAPCPLWDDFLGRYPLVGAAVEGFLRAIIFNIQIHKRFLYVVGRHDAGKSKMMEFVEKLIPWPTCQLSPATIQSLDDHGIAQVEGTVASVVHDIQATSWTGPGLELLKTIVGADAPKIRVNQKMIPVHDYYPGAFHFIFVGNQTPSMPSLGAGGALANRALLVAMDQPLVVKDPTYGTRLAAELNAVFSRLVAQGPLPLDNPFGELAQGSAREAATLQDWDDWHSPTRRVVRGLLKYKVGAFCREATVKTYVIAAIKALDLGFDVSGEQITAHLRKYVKETLCGDPESHQENGRKVWYYSDIQWVPPQAPAQAPDAEATPLLDDSGIDWGTV